MTLDRRNIHEIVQALLRARNRRGEGDVFSNVAQINTASGDRTYGASGGTRFSSGVPIGDEAARQSELVPTPRPHPFRDPTRFSYTGEIADMAKANGVPAYDQLALNVAPGTLSRLANLQTAYGRLLQVNAAYSPPDKKRHRPDGAHPKGKAFDLNIYPATDAERARVIELATQMGFGGTGTYQGPEDTKKGFNDPRVHIDVLRPRPWGYDRTAKTTPAWHRTAIARGLAAGEPDMEAIAAKVAEGYPIFGPRRRRLREP